VTEAQGH